MLIETHGKEEYLHTHKNKIVYHSVFERSLDQSERLNLLLLLLLHSQIRNMGSLGEKLKNDIYVIIHKISE